MNNDDLTELKIIKDDLEVALLHLEAAGYSHEDMGWIYLEGALDELKEFLIGRIERDNQTPRPVIVFRRRLELNPADHV
jgi:hypothetical protein